jgi:hypothetical protein
MEVRGQLHTPDALTPGKEAPPLGRRLGVPQNQSGRGGKEKNPFPIPAVDRTPVIQPIA